MIRNPVLVHPRRSLHGTCLCLFLLSLFLVLAAACAWSASDAILSTSFEGSGTTAPAGWTTTGSDATWAWDSSVARTGSRSMSISMSGWLVGWAGPRFDVDSSYSSTYPCYVLTGWVRCDYNAGRNYLCVGWYGPDGWICNTYSRYAQSSTNGKWVKLSVMALPPVGATKGQVVLRSDKNEGTVWFDDVSLVRTDIPIAGDKPTASSTDGAQIAPYRALVRDQDTSPLVADALLSLALQYSNAEKTDQTNAELVNLLAKFPTAECAAEAKYLLADMAFTKKPADAESLLTAAADAYPTSEFAPLAKMKQAYLHIPKEHDRDTTHAEFLDVASKYPDSPCAMECLYKAARIQIREPVNYESALAEFDYVAKHSSDRRLQAEAMVDTGLTHLQRFLLKGDDPQDFPKAFEILQGVRTAYPEQGTAIGRAELRIGRYYLYTNKDISAAKRVFTSFLTQYPNAGTTPHLEYQLAYCSFAEKQYADSISKCQAMVADPNVDWGWKAWTIFFTGHCYLKTNELEKAKQAFQSVIDTYPDTEFSAISQRALDVMSKKPKTGTGG